MLEWVAWDSFECEKASHVFGYSFPDPCAFYSRSYYASFWCDLCNSSNYDIDSCPYYTFYAQPDFVSPWDNTEVVLTLHDSSFPLAQCTGLEVGEPFGFGARFDIFDVVFKSEDTLHELHNLDKTPLEGSYDVFMHKESPTLVVIMLSQIPLIILMFHLCIYNSLLPLSMTLLIPLIIL